MLLRYLTLNRLDFIGSNLVVPLDEAGNLTDVDLYPGDTVLQSAVARIEKTLILKTLHQTYWNRSRTAKLLGISRRALFRKMAKFKIGPPDSGVLAHDRFNSKFQ